MILCYFHFSLSPSKDVVLPNWNTHLKWFTCFHQLPVLPHTHILSFAKLKKTDIHFPTKSNLQALNLPKLLLEFALITCHSSKAIYIYIFFFLKLHSTLLQHWKQRLLVSIIESFATFSALSSSMGNRYLSSRSCQNCLSAWET